MNYFNIPTELIEMIKSRKVIPFIGAGFSSPLNLPEWEDLLREIARDVEEDYKITYEEVKEYCQGNPLEIAEYYLIKSNKNIGPLRHSISQAFTYKVPPIMSGAHVELINLGAQQIYTTNYDDLLEKTYRSLGVKVDVIATANDVANIKNGDYQVVKFHGDLKYEDTLVLTESSYFSRLNFDSPMDIKFRGDILGKAVLFMGYSFRDINIRIIWFKLMEMINGLTQNNKPVSYIVRFTENPVLEELYKSVGIKTIILDPKKQFTEKVEMNQLFAEFMFEMVNKASYNNLIPGTKDSLYFSRALYNRTMGLLEHYYMDVDNVKNTMGLSSSLDLVSKRKIPEELYKDIEKILLYVSAENFNLKVFTSETMLYVSKIALKKLKEKGFSDYVFLTLLTGIVFNSKVRELVKNDDICWDEFWSQKMIPAHAERFLSLLFFYHDSKTDSLNIPSQESFGFLVDIACRMLEGRIVYNSPTFIKQKSEEIINKLSEFYPTINDYIPDDEFPNIEMITFEYIEKNNLSKTLI
ncbi:SIR2 family protein [Niallia sp. FSL R7-0648]|uniref:SIR2 family protein n=1 Tax=Niallia sp. FSL R7-0648 TaxID=2954521 RepID=UPI0030F7FA91